MNTILVLGFFDSIHRGHAYLFDRARSVADSCAGSVCVATFDDGFFKGVGREDEEIFLLKERKKLLKCFGVDSVLVFPTDQAFLSRSKDSFLMYLESLDPFSIVVGEDYTFGYKASGKVTDLRNYFERKGIAVYVCPIVKEGGEKISSERIRRALKEGQAEQANLLLGRPFFYSGKVVEGRKVGRKIGFPTLNLNVEREKIKIKSGVYVTETELDGVRYRALTNVGGHPTFNDPTFNVETYVLDRDVNAYGKTVTIYFYTYVRDVRIFNDPSELTEQIKQDAEYAERWFTNDSIRRSGKQ